jgi:hypothetical protein
MQVKIWTMEGDYDVSQCYNRVKVFEEDTYASLRVRWKINRHWSGCLNFGIMNTSVEFGEMKWRISMS